jgi:hypothetical protein
LVSGCDGIATFDGFPAPLQKGLVALGSHTHYFGKVDQNTELRHDFALINEAEVPILITGMRSSCACTWAEGSENFVGLEIAPGQTINYPVFLSTGTLQDSASGQIAIFYRYQSDEPQERNMVLMLEVLGTILPDYRIEPTELQFGEIFAIETQTATRSFRVTPVNLEELEIIDIRSSSNLFTAVIVSSGERGFEVDVTFDGSSLGNSEIVRSHLIIETNSENVPHGLVTLSATYIAHYYNAHIRFDRVGQRRNGTRKCADNFFCSVANRQC